MAVRGLDFKALREALTDDGVRVRAGFEISQRTLAQAVGVSQPYISKIEIGLTAPSKDVLVRLAVALGVSTETLTMALRNTRAKSRHRTPQAPRGTYARRARGPVAKRERRT